MSDRSGLISLFEDARTLLARSDNDFSWSSWRDRDAALAEIDGILAQLREGQLPPLIQLQVLFAPTGPMQEVSLSSGWGQEFLEVAAKFDKALDLAKRLATDSQ